MRKRRIQNYWPILMKEGEECRDARDQFDGGRLDVPGKGRPMTSAHSETDDECICRAVRQQRQRQVSHHLCNRCQRRDTHAIDQEPFPVTRARGDHSRSVVAKDFAWLELLFESLRENCERKRTHGKHRVSDEVWSPFGL